MTTERRRIVIGQAPDQPQEHLATPPISRRAEDAAVPTPQNTSSPVGVAADYPSEDKTQIAKRATRSMVDRSRQRKIR
jgi:hypothetical protein